MKDNGEKVDQSSDDVNLSADDALYKDPGSDTEGIRVVNSFENPLFMVWMRSAALPNFLKLYAIIDEDLDKGMYKMEIKNRSYIILHNLFFSFSLPYLLLFLF